MNEFGKAIFLSYASQDAEAAKRICEALRSSGIEVWFDQSELRGGDAWDQKIRRQIKECALFVPVISANTQARREGYFRLEWRVAVERMRHMDDDLPFLMPVVIDGTTDAEAFVPEKFREVQWTRLPGVAGPVADKSADSLGAFARRVEKLLSGEGSGGTTLQFAAGRSARETRARSAMKRRWLVPVMAGGVTCAIGVIWLFLSRPESTASNSKSQIPNAKRESMAPPATEAQQLIARAWQLINRPDLGRAQLEAADELCRRAAALDATDAEVWAAWSQVDTWYVYHSLGPSDRRRQDAETKTARALQLAPKSFEARLAQACYLVRSQYHLAPSIYAPKVEETLKELLQERPDEPRAALALGILLRNLKRLDEARAALARAARSPAFAALAWNETGWLDIFADPRAADAAADRSIAIEPCWPNLSLKAWLAMFWHGDLEAAKAMFERLPVESRQEDFGLGMAATIFWWRREPAEMIRILQAAPRDWLASNWYICPKTYLVGIAHDLAGRPEAARVEWETALKRVEDHLATNPNSPVVLYNKAIVLARLGNKPEAARLYQLARELGYVPMSIWEACDRMMLGQTDEAMAVLENAVKQPASSITVAHLRLNPGLDGLRSDARFQSLLNRLAGDLRFSPTASPAASSATAKPADQKSVAVLAFANLSDDKENEYFSDGISEELLNVLANVPGLRVAARTSAFYFKEHKATAQEIGQKLGVAHLVEGSVRKAGTRVRIAARLSKADTGEQLWSESYERELKDIFAVQDEIAGRIAQALSVRLGAGVSAGATRNLEAYSLYLKGRSALAQRGAESLEVARQHFEAALALDPDFVSARAGLARTLSIVGLYSFLDLAERTRLAGLTEREARRVVTSDPANAEGWSVLGMVNTIHFWRWREAGEAIERALALAPNDPEIVNFAGDHFRAVGDTARTLALERRAVELNPLHAVNHSDLAWACFVVADYSAAIRHARDALALNATLIEPHDVLIRSLGALRQFDAMRAAIAAARTQARTTPERLLTHAMEAALAEGRRDEATELLAQLTESAFPAAILGRWSLALGNSAAGARWLERAYQQREWPLVNALRLDLTRVAADATARAILEQPELRELMEIRAKNGAAAGNSKR